MTFEMNRVLVGIGVVAVCVWLVVWTAPHAQTQSAGDAQVAAKVRAAIEAYIERDTTLKGGFFVRDTQARRVRDLSFDYVHQGLESAPGGLQVMCVDFLDSNKDRLDIDFVVKSTPSGVVEVTDLKIHKVNGAERK